MSLLYIVCEGRTEVLFVANLLKPHLELKSGHLMEVKAPDLRGYRTYANTRRFIKHVLGNSGSAVAVTTMIDLYKIAKDFPGSGEIYKNPVERVRGMERRVAADIGDPRFVPYLQLHEFEALLLSDILVLGNQYPNRRGPIQALAQTLDKQYPTPEHVDDTRPPSTRIKNVISEYDKVKDGIIAIEQIGLETIRDKCPHFGQWLTHLEDLASAQQ